MTERNRWETSGERNWDFIERDMRARGATNDDIRIARQRWLEDHPAAGAPVGQAAPGVAPAAAGQLPARQPEAIKANAPAYREFLTNTYGDAARSRARPSLATEVVRSPAILAGQLLGRIPGMEGLREWAGNAARLPAGESLRRNLGETGRYDEENELLRFLFGDRR